jgi:serine O-acetyltransferase
MEISLTKSALAEYIKCQINNFFPDRQKIGTDQLKRHVDYALQRAEYCFSHINSKYFSDESGRTFFNHLNGDHYAMFLYFLSHTLYNNSGNPILCDKIFQLNKLLHGIDAFYQVILPDIFLFVHPLGTVLGRAKYSDYFLVYQRCNVGSNKTIYPKLGKYLSLHPGSSVLGNCNVGENSKIGAGSLLLDKGLPANSLYIGNPRDFVIKTELLHSDFWIKR